MELVYGASSKKFLSLDEKMKAINLHNKEKSLSAIANNLNVGKTQIHSVIRLKELILRQWNEGASTSGKVLKARVNVFISINKATYFWFLSVQYNK